MKTPNEEIQYLGQMLTATTEDDTQRLLAIAQRTAEIANIRRHANLSENDQIQP